MKLKRALWISLAVVIVALAAGGTLYWTRDQSTAQAKADETDLSQAVVQLGTLTISTSSLGTLAAVDQTDLGFQASGVIVEMNVNVGDAVNAGDVLARLQVDTTPNQLAAQLASAKLAVIEAGQALEALYQDADLKAAQALIALEEAEQALEELEDNAPEVAAAQQAVAEAQQAVTDAEMQVYILNSTASQEAMDITRSSLMFKEKELAEMEKRIARVTNQIKSAPDKLTWERLRRQLKELKLEQLKMQADYDKRLYRYEHMDEPAEEDDIALAQAELTTAQLQLRQAQQELDGAQAGAAGGDLAIAEVQLAGAQDTWERWKDGPDPQEIAMAEERLAVAQARLAIAQEVQLVIDLVAPHDGIVLSVSAQVNDRLTGGTVLTLADRSQPLVEVYVDESESSYVQIGNRAEIIFDAYPDRTLTGEVIEVSSSLAEVSGEEQLLALVRLDESSSDQALELPLGLNGTVDLITAEVTDAVLVPLEALHETSSGETIVYVLQGEAMQPRQVSVGLMNYTTAEVVGGLSAGETVALGELEDVETTQITETNPGEP